VTAPQLLAAGDATSTSASVAFWVLAVISVAAGLGMVLARRAVHCAVLLAVVMLSLAVLYAAAGAPFLAFVQIIVYTGAVLMLFLFVLMIVGVRAADSTRETIRGQRLAAGVAGIGLLVLLSLVLGHATIGPAAAAGAGYGTANLQSIARIVFTRYVYAFEVTSALLITAALGAMVLAHREPTAPKPTQADLARRRVAGGHPTPLPGPGVYARHNAVDMPALLPDGTPSRLSVSPVIARAGIQRREPAGPIVRLPSGGGGEAAQFGAGPGAHAETDASRADAGSGPADSGSSQADSGSGAAGNGRADNGAGSAHEEGRS
jgi:NADH-quinone oxidoreductase subunit J